MPHYWGQTLGGFHVLKRRLSRILNLALFGILKVTEKQGQSGVPHQAQRSQVVKTKDKAILG